MSKVNLPHVGLYGLSGGQVSASSGNKTTNDIAGDANDLPGTMFSRWWDGIWKKEDDQNAKDKINEDLKKSNWLNRATEIIDVFRQIPGVEDWFSKNIGEKYLNWECPRNTDSCESKEVKNLEKFVKDTALRYRLSKASIQRLSDQQLLISVNSVIAEYKKRAALLRFISTTYSNRTSTSIQARIFGADRTDEALLVVIAFVNDYLAIKNTHLQKNSTKTGSAKAWTGDSFNYQTDVYLVKRGRVVNGEVESGVNTATVGILATTALLSALAYTYYSAHQKQKKNAK